LTAAQKLARKYAGVDTGAPQVSPFKREIAGYLLFMDSHDGQHDDLKDPLKLWSLIAGRFPILARFARRVLAISATSADVERLFSHVGDVCTPDRNSLSPQSINMLATCNLYLRRQLGIYDKRTVKSAIRVQKFAILTTDMLLVYPTDYEDLLDAADEQADPDYGGEDDVEDEDDE
jgi:hypothetical protein